VQKEVPKNEHAPGLADDVERAGDRRLCGRADAQGRPLIEMSVEDFIPLAGQLREAVVSTAALQKLGDLPDPAEQEFTHGLY
jgi:hypothetical protein